MTARVTRLAPLCIALAISALDPASAAAQTFRRPTACDSCIANWFYFDEDAASGPDDDWNCAGSSYDGHSRKLLPGVVGKSKARCA